jgi:septum site-determining protein MinD
MRRVIAVLSGKGGVGKTVLTLNLGLALNHFGEDNVVIDADLQNPNVGLHLGFYEYALTIHDALEKEISILDVVHLHSSGLKIVPASLSLEYIYTNPERMRELFYELEGHVLVDSAPSLGKEAIASIKACDEVLVVTNPEITAVTDCIRLIELLRKMNKKILGVVVNRKTNKHYEIDNKEIEDVCKAPIIGVIPEDENVKKAISRGVPVIAYKPHSPASIAIKKIAAEILEKDYKPPRLLLLRRLLG